VKFLTTALIAATVVGASVSAFAGSAHADLVREYVNKRVNVTGTYVENGLASFEKATSSVLKTSGTTVTPLPGGAIETDKNEGVETSNSLETRLSQSQLRLNINSAVTSNKARVGPDIRVNNVNRNTATSGAIGNYIEF
jgi:hypothetical protein